jgi:hypothetical protein
MDLLHRFEESARRSILRIPSAPPESGVRPTSSPAPNGQAVTSTRGAWRSSIRPTFFRPSRRSCGRSRLGGAPSCGGGGSVDEARTCPGKLKHGALAAIPPRATSQRSGFASEIGSSRGSVVSQSEFQVRPFAALQLRSDERRECANTGRCADGSANELTGAKNHYNLPITRRRCEAELSALCRRRGRPVELAVMMVS